MRILRAVAGIGEPTFVEMDGPIVKVALARTDLVEFWFVGGVEAEPRTREFMVVGTGHWFDPDQWEYVGTAERHPETSLVWHLLERR